MSFNYNDEGIRASKTVNGVTTHYVFSGNLLISEYTDTEAIVYIYDVNGSPIGFRYRLNTYADDVWDTYWYVKNVQGDIVEIYSSAGVKLVTYKYDAWGKTTVAYSNNGASTTAVNNNLTYRGYYYDSDLSMYYLQNRYYDPAICRFISPDSLMSGTNGSLHGFNLYVYCFNNPISYTDSEGNWPKLTEAILGVLNAILISVEGELFVGVGLGISGNASLFGIPVGAELQAAEKEVLVYEDGGFKLGHESEIGANISVGFFELGDSISYGHYYDDELCDCNMWNDSFAEKELCDANKIEHSGSELTIGLGGSLLVGVGIGGSLSFNFTNLVNEIINVFEE